MLRSANAKMRPKPIYKYDTRLVAYLFIKTYMPWASKRKLINGIQTELESIRRMNVQNAAWIELDEHLNNGNGCNVSQCNRKWSFNVTSLVARFFFGVNCCKCLKRAYVKYTSFYSHCHTSISNSIQIYFQQQLRQQLLKSLHGKKKIEKYCIYIDWTGALIGIG